MAASEPDALRSLTEKEKLTLRLILRGHDAKSIARTQNLSVHTINERLRDARRKLAVSSSREAARMLLQSEATDPPAPDPQNDGDRVLRADGRGVADEAVAVPDGAGAAIGRRRIRIGVIAMSLTLGLLALSMLAADTPAPAPAPPVEATAVDAVVGDPVVVNTAVVDTARAWLALLDQYRWAETYQGTGTAFQRLNTLQTWTSVSQQVRVPLGAVTSRAFLSQQNLPAPPAGYEVVRFRTSFANKPDALETVTLEREEGGWRIVGIIIE